jgi:hypothetical protein
VEGVRGKEEEEEEEEEEDEEGEETAGRRLIARITTPHLRPYEYSSKAQQ